ncbi:MAG: hypothetical protein ACK46G_15370 [Flavobacteriales bacterium]|jgi:hypothetical protein
MQRRHFELERGYLNIDGEALYFTRSGNWQEALGTKELSGSHTPRRTLHVLFGFLLIGARAFFDLLHLPSQGPEGLLLTAGLAGLGVLVLYHTLRHDLATTFRIPFSKLRNVQSDGRNVTFTFVDGDWKERSRTVALPADAIEHLEATWRSKLADPFSE